MEIIPDKFEDLTMQQREYFARLGFDLFKIFGSNLLTDSLVTSKFQEFTEEQQKLQAIMNSNTQQLMDLNTQQIIR